MINEINGLLIVGLATICGLAAGLLMNKIKLPAVTGYVLIGVILGESICGVFTPQMIEQTGVINGLALGFIAFSIGEELEFRFLRQLGKSIFLISIFEAMGAFILVTAAMYLVIHELHLALVLGAVASATAPAATMMVLRETRAKGILTSTLMAVVAIDDAMALILYGFASSLAKVMMLPGNSIALSTIIINPLIEIFGALFLGILSGLLLGFFAKKMSDQSELLILVVGTLVLNTGLAQFFHFSELLSNMALGTAVCNFAPGITRRIFKLTSNITPPIYVMFFVLAGARLQLDLVKVIGVIGIVYTVVRIIGKVGGAALGGIVSSAPTPVRRYLGLGLLSQIGVAIGLAIMIQHEFPASTYGEAGEKMGLWVVNILLFTTIITEFIGPILTKYAVTKAGEVKIDDQRKDGSFLTPTEVES